MDNIREKLVELLMQVEDNMCDDCGREPVGCAVVAIVDYLIANGVTVKGVENDTVETVTDCHGCEYCREDFDGYVRMNGAFSIRNSYHREGWTISAGNVKPRQIYYCPMCGRKLTTPPKGE